MKEIDPGRPVSLYLHFPFCVRKCRYCDFLSGPASEEERDNYIELLCREIRLRSSEVPGQVDTVFLGGGTPSLMTAAQMRRLMECLSDLTTKNFGFWGGSTRPAKHGRSFVLQGQPDLPISIWT